MLYTLDKLLKTKTMNEDINNQTNVNPGVVPPSRPSGEKVIQPSESIKQELQAQQQVQPQITQPSAPVPQQPVGSNPSNIYPEPAPGQMKAGMSASQMGFNQPKSKLFDVNPKQLIIKGIVALIILGGIFTALVMTNIVALSEFKNTSYTNSEGTNFKLEFYTKHGSKQLRSDITQLVSKVSKEGKFPIALSISTTDETSGYNRAKDCASFTKVFDVQNNNLNQKISVCDFGKQLSQGASGNVYIAGFMHNNQAHIVTIGQDYGSIDLSSQSGAQESLSKFGMEPYKADIEKIVSSIKVE
jgi:hypothetical protein